MLTLIAAAGSHSILGSSHKDHWDSPIDREFFYTETSGGVLMMDDKIAKSLRDLPFKNRVVVVVGSPDYELPSRWIHFPSTPGATQFCWTGCYSRVYALGHGSFYETLLPKADRILLSRSSQPGIEERGKFPTPPKQDWKLANSWQTGCETVPEVQQFFRAV